MTKTQDQWWRGAVIYQIYPRSYKDTNGDGVGDLKGITESMDYIASLGVDAIWISPFFVSPMKDYGYDVADYRDVDPIFGTLADFDELLMQAHDRDIKVIIDMVMSHTSDQHAWFQESRKTRDNAKSDWYVWHDPQADGSPPNNWQSVFGGSSWEFCMHRGQYYLHNFLVSQPDLNLHNPDVQDAVLGEARFWLERGVDGFRLDALNFGMHNRNFEDNPASENPKPQFFNVDFPTPYTMQQHVNSKSQPEMIPFLKKIRALMDEYDARMTVAEIGDEKAFEISVEYTEGADKLHTAYNFSLISGKELSASYIQAPFDELRALSDDCWPSWAFSNHDVERVVTRWGQEYENDPRLAKMLIAMIGSLRGNAFIYQGEELGLPEAHIPYERIEDPWGRYLYPKWQGRDGARTPIPWDSRQANAGFSDAADTWLPIDERHVPLSVSEQQDNPSSVLNFTRDFLRWRAELSALKTGDIQFLKTDQGDKVLAFKRSSGEGEVLCLFNLSPEAIDAKLEDVSALSGQSLYQDEMLSGLVEDSGVVSLPAFGMFWGKC